MNNRVLTAGFIVFGMIVLVSGIAWFSQNYERVEREEQRPPSAAALNDSLFAFKLALQAENIDVQTRFRLDPATAALEPHDTLLLYGNPQLLTPAQSRYLLDWTKSGGHLIVQLPNRVSWVRDGLPQILRDIGVLRHPPGSRGCTHFRNNDNDEATDASSFCGPISFTLNPQAHARIRMPSDDTNSLLYARISLGDGNVDVVTSFDFIEQRALKTEFNQILAKQILVPNYQQGVFHIWHLPNDLPSLWLSILRQGWPVWIPLLLALFGWLWRRGQRFGPFLPSPISARRSLLEHVYASGEFLFRRHQEILLYNAARDAFLIRLRRLDPIAATLEGEVQATLIAQRLNVPVFYVRNALLAPAKGNRHEFRDRVRALIHMRNQL